MRINAIMGLVAAGLTLVSFSAQRAEASSWVKLCETIKVAAFDKDGKLELDKDGKPVIQEKQACVTKSDYFDAQVLSVLATAGLLELEGSERKVLSLTFPRFALLPANARAFILTPEQWKQGEAKETIDLTGQKPIQLRYINCVEGCVAELDATKEMLDQLGGGAGIVAQAIAIDGRVMQFRFPLDGFKDALVSKPQDARAYQQAQAKYIAELRQKRVEEIKAKQAAGGQAAPKKQ